MSKRLAIAPIAKAWETFQKVSHVHHIANDQDYDNATRIADALLDAGAMDAGHPTPSTRHS